MRERIEERDPARYIYMYMYAWEESCLWLVGEESASGVASCVFCINTRIWSMYLSHIRMSMCEYTYICEHPR